MRVRLIAALALAAVANAAPLEPAKAAPDAPATVKFCGQRIAVDEPWVVCDSDVASLRPLTALRQLRILRLRRVADLRALPQLRTVVILELRDPPSLSGLGSLPQLAELTVHDAKRVDSLVGLAGAPTLQELWISGSRVADLAPIASIKHLRRLSVGLHGLVHLRAERSTLRDSRPLLQLPALRRLVISTGQLSPSNARRLRARRVTIVEL